MTNIRFSRISTILLVMIFLANCEKDQEKVTPQPASIMVATETEWQEDRQKNIDTVSAVNPWSNFISNPTNDTYLVCKSEIHESIQGHHEIWESPTERILLYSAAFDQEPNSHLLGELFNLIIQRNSFAISLGFQIRSLAVGPIAEELEVLLGGLINYNPELFLSELNANRVNLGNRQLPIFNLGDEFVDEFELMIKEVDRRIESFSGVTNIELISRRDECITALEDYKLRLAEILNTTITKPV